MKKVILNQTGEKIQEDLNFTEKLFAQYSSAYVYNKGDLVRHDERVYRCNVDNTSGDWNESKWTSVSINELLNNKVDKVSGKGLSTNDFTNEEKEKLDNLNVDAFPNYIILPQNERIHDLSTNFINSLNEGDIIKEDDSHFYKVIIKTNNLCEYALLDAYEQEHILNHLYKYKYNISEERWENIYIDDTKASNIISVEYVSMLEQDTIENLKLGDMVYEEAEDMLYTYAYSEYIDLNIDDGHSHSAEVKVLRSGNIEQLLNNGLSNVRRFIYNELTHEWESLSANYKDIYDEQVCELRYAQLKYLRDNGKLIPGNFYRITDYETTTTQEESISANHKFDIVVSALSKNQLSENASAVMHCPICKVIFANGSHIGGGVTRNCYVYEENGMYTFVDVETLLGISGIALYECIILDLEKGIIVTHNYNAQELSTPNLFYDYFAKSKLESWEIKYCLDNDTSRFLWADTTSGKGVIYYMKDEFYNECYYDFKNIKFKRYKILTCENCPSLVGRYFGIDGILTNYMTLDTTDYKYYYTFDCCGTDYSLNAIGTTLTDPEGNTFTLDQIQCTKCQLVSETNEATTLRLSNLVLILEASRDCMFKVKVGTCGASTFLGGCTNLEFTKVYNSIIGCTNSVINGYVGQNSSIFQIANSIICGNTKGISRSRIGSLDSCCMVSNNTIAIIFSDINAAHDNVLISDDSALYEAYINYMGTCDIKCTQYCICRSTIGTMISCQGNGSKYYFNNVNGTYVHTLTYVDESESHDGFVQYTNFNSMGQVVATRLHSCTINNLYYSNFKSVWGSTFPHNMYLNCAQDMSGCTFDNHCWYLNISSQDTTQTIKRTNFHNIQGEENNLKNVVIPEDYTVEHTVDIYGPGHQVIEIA